MLAECVIDECAKIIESQVGESGTYETVVPGLCLYRWDSAQSIACDSGQIMVSFIVKGQKETMITGRRFLYRLFSRLAAIGFTDSHRLCWPTQPEYSKENG